MKRLACALAALTLASLAGAATNLNSSKSNAYRLTYSTAIVTPAQAAAILAELDKTPEMSEAAIKQVLPGLLKKNGVDPTRVKKTIVRPGGAAERKLESINKGGSTERKSISIIVLDKPEDEAAAIAVDEDGGPQGKGKGVADDKASPRPMTGELTAKVTRVDPRAKTFSVTFQDRAITFSAARLGKLPTVGENIAIAFTATPGEPPMATSTAPSSSRITAGNKHCDYAQTYDHHSPFNTLNVCK